ncbi:MAG: methionine synthase I, cobalamin-binding domain protein [Thermoplasmata archaeon]|nr:methionine synthase I, cobalamin-binding domain protein [Thermoplasmata archaeon]
MTNEEILKKLSDAVVGGKVDQSKEAAQEALDAGMAALDAINEGLVAGMSIVGEKYAAHQVYLPQVLMSAHTMYAGLDILLPAIPKDDLGKMLKAATCVVEGDVHDIGKNIVKTMLTAGGFDVIDLGKDVPIDVIIETVEKEKLNALAMSTLMTPTMDGMKAVVDGLVENGTRSNVKVCIGGPPTSPAFAEEIGADHRDNNAQDCVGWLKGVL